MVRVFRLIVLGNLAVGCRQFSSTSEAVSFLDNSRPREQPQLQAAQTNTPMPSRQSASTQLPPLVGYPWLVSLASDLPHHDVVTPPLGATEPRPIVIAIHGAGDRPDWACGGWRIGVEAYPFVVCPVGLPMGHSVYAWSGTRSIATAVDRALTTVRSQFAEYANSDMMIYAGFSQGATLAGPYLIENALRFPVAVIAEGGYNYTSEPWFARKYKAGGGQRLLLLCGTASCLSHAKRAQIIMGREGLLVIVTGNATAGHNMNGVMQEAIQRDWHRLVTGVHGWATYSAHRWKKRSPDSL